jgi:hypothetical protein
LVWDLGTGRNQDSGELFFPVSSRVQIKFIFLVHWVYSDSDCKKNHMHWQIFLKYNNNTTRYFVNLFFYALEKKIYTSSKSKWSNSSVVAYKKFWKFAFYLNRIEKRQPLVIKTATLDFFSKCIF